MKMPGKKRPVACATGRLKMLGCADGLCLLGAVAIAAEHGPAGLWFEGDGRGLAAFGADGLMKFAFGSGAVEISVAAAAELARRPIAAAAAIPATLWLIGFALFAAVTAPLGRMFETALGVATLIFRRVDKLGATVRALNHHVFVHLASTSRY